MAKEVTRYVPHPVERELWARSAGRCQFDGCNRLLYKSPVTQEQVNIAEKAHIYSFAVDGPRGHGPLKDEEINDLANLMLVCHDCHKTIDVDEDGTRYSAELLRRWKNEHELRIVIVTGVDPSKKSHVLLYGANIGDQTSKLQPAAAMDAMFPDWYPAEERPIQVSMTWEGRDSDPAYWVTEAANLRNAVNRQLQPILNAGDCSHLSIFALAPMPLMVLLGSLVTDKMSAQAYQLHREPHQTWKWLQGPDNFSFHVKPPPSPSMNPPALVISLSDTIAHERVTSVLGTDVAIWELTIERPNNDFLKSKDQLSLFRETARKLMVDIGKLHGKGTPISIFPAMPVACAVELGRIRMPKADPEWILYDQNPKHGGFIRALEIRGAV